MFERLDQIEARYDELTQALSSPEMISDSAKYQKTAKAHSEIAPIVEKYREYKDLTSGIAESKAVLADEKDPEMRAYAQEELDKLEAARRWRRGRAQGAAASERSERRKRTSSSKFAPAPAATRPPLRRGNVPHVHPLRGNEAAGRSRCCRLRSHRWAA